MTWYELLVLFFFLAAIVSIPIILWFLEKPERELRKKRLEAEWKFYHTAGYVFEHIACDINRYDAALFNIESAMFQIADFKEDK